MFDEVNVVKKHLKRGMSRIALVYPSLYEVMASSLSVHIMYYLVNELFDEVYVERFHVRNLHGEEPLPRSLETETPLKDFELIITSIHYEPDIANLVRILYYGSLDPRRSKRKVPIIAGGPPIIANPKPYSDIVDVMVIGEIESTLPRIIDTWLSNRGDKERFLEEVSSLKYTYVPGYDDDKTIYKDWVRDLDNTFYPIRQFRKPSYRQVFENGFLLETSRGCRYWCRFCLEGHIFNPYRFRKLATLKKLVEKGLNVNNVDRVIVYSLIYPSSSDERALLEYLISNGIEASIPSLRIDLVDDDLLEIVRQVGQKTLTLAPETFSSKIQRLIGKYVDLNPIHNILFRVIENGFNLKLYVMYGFKGESFEDIMETINVLKKIAGYGRRRGVSVRIGVNPLVPKPWTVFQWIGMVELERAKSILRIFKRELRGLVETRALDINWAWVQASISLADEKISPILVRWGIMGGDLGSWRRILGETGYNTKYVFEGYRYGDKLPWDNIVLDNIVGKLVEREYPMIRDLVGIR